MIFDIPVYLMINSAYSNTKKLKINILYLFKKKLFCDLVLINKKEHKRAIIGIYKGRTILLFKTVVISFFVFSLQLISFSLIDPFIH